MEPAGCGGLVPGRGSGVGVGRREGFLLPMSHSPASPATQTGNSSPKPSCFKTPTPVAMVTDDSVLARPLQPCRPFTAPSSGLLSAAGASSRWRSDVEGAGDRFAESEVSSPSCSFSTNERPSLRMAWRSGESLAALAMCEASGDWAM